MSRPGMRAARLEAPRDCSIAVCREPGYCRARQACQMCQANRERDLAMKRRTRYCMLLASLLLMPIPAMAQDPAATLKELAPTGTLRVGVAVGPAASPLWATKDPSTGKPRG